MLSEFAYCIMRALFPARRLEAEPWDGDVTGTSHSDVNSTWTDMTGNRFVI